MTFGDAWLGIDAPPAPRRPVAGWVETVTARWDLSAGVVCAQAVGVHGRNGASWRAWTVDDQLDFDWSDFVEAPTLEAAQLAAEDALRAVIVDAAAALGLRVVPS